MKKTISSSLLIILIINLFLISCQKTPAQQPNNYNNVQPFPVGKALVNLKIKEVLNNDGAEGLWVNAEVMSIEGYGSSFGDPLSPNQTIKIHFPSPESANDLNIDLKIQGYIEGSSPELELEPSSEKTYYKMYKYTIM